MSSLAKPWPLDAERELLADACILGHHPDSLWNFVRFAAGWHYRIIGSKRLYWLSDRVHKPLLADIQARIEKWKADRAAGNPDPLKILVVVFRGWGKTNTLTTVLPAYLSLDEPNLTSAIGSATHPGAKDFLSQIKPILDGTDAYSLFTWLYGNWKHPERMWAGEAIETAYRKALGVHEPSIGTFGVETGITGQHPLFCAFDDPLVEEKLNDGGVWNGKANKSLDSISYAFVPETFFLLVGTRYLEDDPIGNSLRTVGVASWYGHPPLEDYPQTDDGYHVYHLQARDISNTDNFEKGEPCLPEAGYTDANLSYRERKNPITYAAQMMNNPRAGEHTEITREQIEPLKIARENLPDIEYATLHLDTAFLADADKRRAKGDRSVIETWLHDLRRNGMVYLDNISAKSNWRSEDFDDELIRVLTGLRSRGISVRAITDEKEIGGKEGMYRRHLETLIGRQGLRIPEIIQISRAGKNKILRIRKSLGYWLEGYVRLVRDAQNLNLLIGEVTGLGYAAHDDLADAMSDVFHPDIWRPPTYARGDFQPSIPVQPGDEILKGRIEQELHEMEREIRARPGSTPTDPQPFEDLMRKAK